MKRLGAREAVANNATSGPRYHYCRHPRLRCGRGNLDGKLGDAMIHSHAWRVHCNQATDEQPQSLAR